MARLLSGFSVGLIIVRRRLCRLGATLAATDAKTLSPVLRCEDRAANSREPEKSHSHGGDHRKPAAGRQSGVRKKSARKRLHSPAFASVRRSRATLSPEIEIDFLALRGSGMRAAMQ